MIQENVSPFTCTVSFGTPKWGKTLFQGELHVGEEFFQIQEIKKNSDGKNVTVYFTDITSIKRAKSTPDKPRYRVMIDFSNFTYNHINTSSLLSDQVLLEFVPAATNNNSNNNNNTTPNYLIDEFIRLQKIATNKKPDSLRPVQPNTSTTQETTNVQQISINTNADPIKKIQPSIQPSIKPLQEIQTNVKIPTASEEQSIFSMNKELEIIYKELKELYNNELSSHDFWLQYQDVVHRLLSEKQVKPISSIPYKRLTLDTFSLIKNPSTLMQRIDLINAIFAQYPEVLHAYTNNVLKLQSIQEYEFWSIFLEQLPSIFSNTPTGIFQSSKISLQKSDNDNIINTVGGNTKINKKNEKNMNAKKIKDNYLQEYLVNTNDNLNVRATYEDSLSWGTILDEFSTNTPVTIKDREEREIIDKFIRNTNRSCEIIVSNIHHSNTASTITTNTIGTTTTTTSTKNNTIQPLIIDTENIDNSLSFQSKKNTQKRVLCLTNTQSTPINRLTITPRSNTINTPVNLQTPYISESYNDSGNNTDNNNGVASNTELTLSNLCYINKLSFNDIINRYNDMKSIPSSSQHEILQTYNKNLNNKSYSIIKSLPSSHNTFITLTKITQSYANYINKLSIASISTQQQIYIHPNIQNKVYKYISLCVQLCKHYWANTNNITQQQKTNIVIDKLCILKEKVEEFYHENCNDDQTTVSITTRQILHSLLSLVSRMIQIVLQHSRKDTTNTNTMRRKLIPIPKKNTKRTLIPIQPSSVTPKPI